MDYYRKLDYRFINLPHGVRLFRNGYRVFFIPDWLPDPQRDSRDILLRLPSDLGGGSIPTFELEASNEFLSSQFGYHPTLPIFIKTVEACTDDHYPAMKKIVERRYIINPQTRCADLFKITSRSQYGNYVGRWVTGIGAEWNNTSWVDPNFALYGHIVTHLLSQLSYYTPLDGQSFLHRFYENYSEFKQDFIGLFRFDYAKHVLHENLRFFIENVESEYHRCLGDYGTPVERLQNLIKSLEDHIPSFSNYYGRDIQPEIGRDPLTFSHLSRFIPLHQLTMVREEDRIDYSPCASLYPSKQDRGIVDTLFNDILEDESEWLLGNDILDLIEECCFTDAHITFYPRVGEMVVEHAVCRYGPYLWDEDHPPMTPYHYFNSDVWGRILIEATNLLLDRGGNVVYADKDDITRIDLQWNYDDEGRIDLFGGDKVIFSSVFNFNMMTLLTPVGVKDNVELLVTPERFNSLRPVTPNKVSLGFFN